MLRAPTILALAAEHGSGDTELPGVRLIAEGLRTRLVTSRHPRTLHHLPLSLQRSPSTSSAFRPSSGGFRSTSTVFRPGSSRCRPTSVERARPSREAARAPAASARPSPARARPCAAPDRLPAASARSRSRVLERAGKPQTRRRITLELARKAQTLRGHVLELAQAPLDLARLRLERGYDFVVHKILAAMTDFFISYTHADRPWTEWIAWILEEAEHKARIQAWDFRPGGNFVIEMQKVAIGSERTIAVSLRINHQPW